MSKRNTKQAFVPAKRPGDLKRAVPAKKGTPTKSRTVSRSGQIRNPGRVAATAAPLGNVLVVRIIAGVIAVAALAGGLTWSLTTKSGYNATLFIGLAVLGIVAGLALLTVFRTERVLQRLQSLR